MFAVFRAGKAAVHEPGFVTGAIDKPSSSLGFSTHDWDRHVCDRLEGCRSVRGIRKDEFVQAVIWPAEEIWAAEL